MTDVDSGVVARFFVAGRPRTKGHLQPRPQRRGNGKLAITVHDRPELKAWMQTLIKGIREQVGIVPIVRGRKIVGVEPPWPYEGPVVVDAMFYFERQRGVDSQTWPSHDTPYPTAEDIGDEDTLRRAVLDALTQSGLLADDRWVVGPGSQSGKRWLSPFVSHGPGVECTVRVAP